jgi:undecaprenyl-diphosphatase
MSIWVVAILLVAFGLSAAAVGRKPLAFDRTIMLALRNPTDPSVPIGPCWFRKTVRDLTSFGSTIVLGTLTFAVSLYLFLAHRPEVAWLILAAFLGGLALNNLLKIAYSRPRPALIAREKRLYTTSFPSGHAAMSAVAYLTMGTLLARAYPAFPTQVCFMALAILLTVCVGLSRIYLGIHYPTDVLAGWCLGAAWSLMCFQVAAWLNVGL